MANIGEWAKGITFFIFITLMFYYLWDNIFSNIIDFVGSDVFGIGSGSDDSVAILKTFAWVSFVLLYIMTGGGYLMYSIIVGSRGQGETKPIELLKAVASWSILMPFLTIIYGIVYFMVTSLNDADILTESGLETQATTFSWMFGLITVIILTLVPFYFVLRGYNINLFGGQETPQQ